MLGTISISVFLCPYFENFRISASVDIIINFERNETPCSSKQTIAHRIIIKKFWITVCDPACINGQCTSPNHCSCSSGWTGNLCDIPICDPVCLNGQCTSPNKCSCSPGWMDNLCDIPVCDPVCLNGQCTSPNNCSCSPGWM
ncbi:unnamed protein product, partial [Meganyctiphanes norvegica]